MQVSSAMSTMTASIVHISWSESPDRSSTVSVSSVSGVPSAVLCIGPWGEVSRCSANRPLLLVPPPCLCELVCRLGDCAGGVGDEAGAMGGRREDIAKPVKASPDWALLPAHWEGTQPLTPIHDSKCAFLEVELHCVLG